MNKCIFEYEKNDTGVMLKKFLSGGEEVEIPAAAVDAGELTGLPVTAIGAECFKENGMMIYKIIVPESVKVLEHDAFAYCVSLQELILPETIETIGADYLIASGLEEAYIPASVKVIERPELIDRSFRVSEDNPVFFSDGYGLYKRGTEGIVLVAVNASDTRKSYTLNPDTDEIAYPALRDASALEELVIPQHLHTIPEGALTFSGGTAGDSDGIRRISINPDNDKFILKYGCICERLGDDKLKILRFLGGEDAEILWDVSIIGEQAFRNREIKDLLIFDTVEKIGREAFSWCPVKKCVIRSYHEGGDENVKKEVDDTTVFFGDEDKYNMEKLLEGFGKNGKVYDFAVFDDFLEKEYVTLPRVEMILTRLLNPLDLDPESRSALENRIRDNIDDILELSAIEHNAGVIKDMGELGFFTKDNIDRSIDKMTDLGEKETTAWLMSYKNSHLKCGDDWCLL